MKKYREQRNDDNVLTGYIRDSTTIPLDKDNLDYQDILRWMTDGNFPDLDNTLLDRTKKCKVEEYKAEGVKRIGMQVPAWGDFDRIELIASIWNMLGNPNTAQISAKDIYTYVKNIAIPSVMAQTDIIGVQAIDVISDPNWP